MNSLLNWGSSYSHHPPPPISLQASTVIRISVHVLISGNVLCLFRPKINICISWTIFKGTMKCCIVIVLGYTIPSITLHTLVGLCISPKTWVTYWYSACDFTCIIFCMEILETSWYSGDWFANFYGALHLFPNGFAHGMNHQN